MSAGELAEGDVVAALLESRNDQPAAAVDWKDRIVGAVRHEELRVPVWRPPNDKARRKCHDSREQISVDESQRQRVGGAVRKSSDGNPIGINGDRLEYPLEGAIDEVNIGAEASADGIPRRVARIGGQHGNPCVVWRRSQTPQNPFASSGGAMQENEKRQRRVPGLARQAKDRIPVGVQPQRPFFPSRRSDVCARAGRKSSVAGVAGSQSAAAVAERDSGDCATGKGRKVASRHT
jgi:hypothetical protein